MRLQPVNSSVLAAVGYDAASQTLTVEFRHGGRYEFFNVPERVHQELMTAGSHGEYFARHIRGRYGYRRL
jgi:KTSC domain-containing protein